MLKKEEQRTKALREDKDLSEILEDLDYFLARLERSSSRKNLIVAGLAIALIIATSGWWLSSKNHSDVERNGRIADCRAKAFAARLDGFTIVVAPTATPEEKKQASIKIVSGKDLQKAYDECLDAG